VSALYRVDEEGRQRLHSVRLRITQRCNSGCLFCFIPYERRVLDEAGVEPVIRSTVKAGARDVLLTGGEPTLHEGLARLIGTAREAGARRVGIQTNGMRLADGKYCAALVGAGLDFVEVSIPSHRPRVMERITGVKGALRNVLRGMENLSGTGAALSINHTLCRQNFRDAAAFTRFMTSRFRPDALTYLMAAPFAPELARPDIIVRYSDAAPHLRKALDYCLGAGVRFEGLWEKCGLPACILGGSPAYWHGAVPIAPVNRSDDFMEAEACGPCALRSRCYWVRKLYARLYGTGELRSVTG